VRLGQPPVLPLFNNNLSPPKNLHRLRHAPVWIFQKSADFDIEQVREVLNAVDLSTVR
jgi:hypothetical protein